MRAPVQTKSVLAQLAGLLIETFPGVFCDFFSVRPQSDFVGIFCALVLQATLIRLACLLVKTRKRSAATDGKRPNIVP